MKKLYLVLLLVLSSITFGLEARLVAEKVSIGMDGKEFRQEAKSISPGEVIEYIFTISNKETTSEYGLQPKIPVPDLMVLQPDTISPGKFMVSVDGRTFLNYPVFDEEGMAVDPSAYKSVRWNINEIKPKEILEVKFRAILSQ